MTRARAHIHTPARSRARSHAAARVLLAGAMLVGVGSLAGCSAAEGPVLPGTEARIAPAERIDDAPGDFSLSVTVFNAEVDDRTPESAFDRSLRPARYLVQPDAVLRSAVGPGVRPSMHPPYTRQLVQRQVDQLWRAVRDSGLLEPAQPTRIDSVDTYLPPPTGPTAVVEVAAAGERRAFSVPLDTGDAEAIAVRQLVDRLAALAWLPE
ncbi:MAG: hypothetical protein EA378_10650 [Phycisphaerales bacterium]|nr:MAG: hypothetical protein EA378_10650 [Phycisphaerales bacterium]